MKTAFILVIICLFSSLSNALSRPNTSPANDIVPPPSLEPTKTGGGVLTVFIDEEQSGILFNLMKDVAPHKIGRVAEFRNKMGISCVHNLILRPKDPEYRCTILMDIEKDGLGLIDRSAP